MDFSNMHDIDDELDPLNLDADFEDIETEIDTLPALDTKVPGAKSVRAHPCKVKRKRGKPRELRTRNDDDITHVVIHSLGSGGNASNAVKNWKRGGGRNCSKPHYAVGRDGTLYQVVAEKFIPQASNQLNNRSIAVEHGYDKAKFPDALYLASSALLRDICNRYGIPKTRSNILGHDEINQSGCRKGGSGECHGDPGGYWDWDYYMALLKWDGADSTVKPYRRIMDSREARHINSKAKKVLGASKTVGNPLFFNSYGDNYYKITPSRDEELFCEYKTRVPVEGEYVISAWWPINVKRFNPSVTFTVLTDTSSLSITVNQRSLRKTTRKTFALPFTPRWQTLAKLNLKPGDIVTVQISRQSSSKGLIVADAIRLLCGEPKPQPFRPPDVCIADELGWLTGQSQEVSEALSSGLLITQTPTPCAYYRIKPGDTLVGVAARAYGKPTCGGSFACAQTINNHPYNQQYWNAKLAGKVFKPGRISFSPRFSGKVEYPPKPTFKATRGNRFAIIYIPPYSGG